MRRYAIDLDIAKLVKKCPYADSAGTPAGTPVLWRISPMRGGFHILWFCKGKRCKHCAKIEKRFDDPIRRKLDRKRPPEERRILWDAKGKNKAGKWRVF